MKTEKRDWLGVALISVALAPVVMYAVVGAAFMPDVLRAFEPPMLITRIISKISRTTGISFAGTTKLVFSGPAVVAAICFAFRNASRRKARSSAEEQQESQPPPGN